MGTHLIPRNLEGENRILYIFTTKSFLTMLIGAGVGLLLFGFFSLLTLGLVGLVLLILCSLIGFVVGAFKIPDSNVVGLFKKVGGSYLDDVIKRYMFFQKNKKIYVYKRKGE